VAELDLFCAPVRRWFERRFGEPTPPQRAGWPRIAQGADTLIAAPTGSGKTLAAFLLVIDRLVRRALEADLSDQLEVVYVSPLRALSHDVQRNLEEPLREIQAEARALGLALPEVRTAVRTGDTPAAERQAMLRRPPHILVTTPESLYLVLTSEKARLMLRSVRSVIVDEIHAVAGDKRGSHLALSLARLDRVAERRPVRIGLSATQRPLDRLARFLVGTSRLAADAASGPSSREAATACEIIDMGHLRRLDLGLVVPAGDDLGAVASHEQWDETIEHLCREVESHRTTLIFVNTRRLAERLAHRMGEKLGADRVAAHHGSLSRERRLRVETRLKQGELAALVATASLELGIDIGSVDLVCQIGSPRSIGSFLQRVGRSGHALGKTPKGRLFPTTRDELVECSALMRAARAGKLDAIELPPAPLDILAQQLVAACACEEWVVDALFDCVRAAAPYAELARGDFDAVVEMLARGFETPRGRRAAYLHHDRLTGTLRARRGARLVALMSGGAIPDSGDYRVLLDPSDTFVGTVGEDFAVESMAGDVFVLGTHSWRVRRVEGDTLRVTDAEGAPPTVPFWVGEAPARTAELSDEVSRLRQDLADVARAADPERAREELRVACGLCLNGLRQLLDYVRVQLESIHCLPTSQTLVAERFFDESGGMQLVVHSPHGARVNRALALALRKRFCKTFNQELQSAATDDAFVLSLSAAQNFPLEELPSFLSSRTIDEVLRQAVLATPMFGVRWRWNASRALAIPRSQSGKRVPFALQRMRSEDLLTAVFPDQTACQENVTYPIDIPDHPLIEQTLHDCAHEACDVDRARALLEGVENGTIQFQTVETVEPSPFTHEILNARPYAYLDDVPLEERRTRAVSLRRVLPDQVRDLGRLDPAAIDRVRMEAAPVVRTADELYELLLDTIVLDPAALDAGSDLALGLIASRRAACVATPVGERLFAAEMLSSIRALYGTARIAPEVELPDSLPPSESDAERVLDRMVRGYLAFLGPVTPMVLARRLGVPEGEVLGSLLRWEGRGAALRGRFDVNLEGEQFCDRGLLARVHRYTLGRLRREIEPVSAQDFGRFLFRWQSLERASSMRGETGLLHVVELLSGFEAPAVAWESDLLAPRVHGYRGDQLDALCLGGAVMWGRVWSSGQGAGAQSTRATPISIFPRAELDELLHAAADRRDADMSSLRGEARRILELLDQRGALFARELESMRLLLPVQIEAGLRELVAHGLVTCDGFAPLRRLFSSRARPRRARPGSPQMLGRGIPAPEGRWSRLASFGEVPDLEQRAEASARRLLRRYGVVFRDLLARERLPEGWREIHRALRRFEARGEVRGGRFVSGFIGEQFALPSAVPALRAERQRPKDGVEMRVSATDPLNLAGILTPGARISAGHTRFLIYRDGIPIAVIDRGIRTSLEGCVSDATEAQVATASRA